MLPEERQLRVQTLETVGFGGEGQIVQRAVLLKLDPHRPGGGHRDLGRGLRLGERILRTRYPHQPKHLANRADQRIHDGWLLNQSYATLNS